MDANDPIFSSDGIPNDSVVLGNYYYYRLFHVDKMGRNISCWWCCWIGIWIYWFDDDGGSHLSPIAAGIYSSRLYSTRIGWRLYLAEIRRY